jgi:hypothetical protein
VARVDEGPDAVRGFVRSMKAATRNTTRSS